MFFQRKIELSQPLIALFLAIIAIFYHSFFYTIDIFKDSAHFFDIFFFHFAIFFSFFLLLSFNKILLIIFAFFTFVFLAVSNFVFNNFGVTLDAGNIANALQNFDDADSLLDVKKVILYVVLFVILPIFLIAKINIKKSKNAKKIFIISLIVIAVILGFLKRINHNQRYEIILTTYSPISLASGLYNYFQQSLISQKQLKNLEKISEIIPDLALEKKAEKLKIILVLGESARAINFSLNGYERKTNPLLEKQKNLISFKKVSPCYNATSQAVLCLTSHNANFFNNHQKRSSLLAPQSESVIKAFEKIGFKTAFISNQQAIGDTNALLLLASQAKYYLFRDSINKNSINSQYDEVLLPYLQKEISDDDNDFIVIQGNGSHFLFSDDYPENFAKFTPNCFSKVPKECSKQAIINSYDNSILYADYFLNEIIKLLQDKKALLLYVSDHGQFLGEDGIFYHGKPGSYDSLEHQVPMILWASDKFLSDKFYAKKFLKAQTKINNDLSHDNVFDSMLDCAGAEAKLFDRNLSICR
jgi:glucan phosphoethanolaminetransferase (alkaline phosphatase superfamily)